jgi:predicted alpha-1,6-mannanase (GH76 family)
VWTRSRWNDDIMWMIIASERAYELTGNPRYRALAKLNFDRVYARAWSKDFGGGLWWTTQRSGKNTTTNAPAVIAACKLYQDLHDKSYLSKALSLYRWMRRYLFNAKTGEVYDSVVSSGRGMAVLPGRFTYNQGTFIGSADLLYGLTGRQQYYSDALHALAFTKAHLTRGGILQSEGNGRGSNHGGFKGIFVRWALKFVRDNHVTAYNAWFRQNASAAWAHRNRLGLMGQDWSRQTPSGTLYSFDCSSAVALLAVLDSAQQ